MRFQIIVGVVLFLASGTSATLDPDPDSIGFYFDPEATSSYAEIGTLEQFNAYVVLTNPTGPQVADVYYRHRIEFVGEPLYSGAIMWISDYCGNGCIWGGSCGDSCMGNPINWYNRDNYQGFGTVWGHPLQPEEAVVLLSIRLILLEPTEVRFFIEPIAEGFAVEYDSPSYFDMRGNEFPLGVSSGSFELPVAEINTGNRPVRVESSVWGNIKAFYR